MQTVRQESNEAPVFPSRTDLEPAAKIFGGEGHGDDTRKTLIGKCHTVPLLTELWRRVRNLRLLTGKFPGTYNQNP